MGTDQDLLSPRITSLRRELKTGETAALQSFWREVSQQGAPLVEKIPGDDEFVLVTFLWRETDTMSNVVVRCDDFRFSNIVGTPSVKTNAMKKLPGTNVWSKTYRLRSDYCIDYLLSPNDPELIGATTEPWSEHWPHLTSTWQLDPLNPRQVKIAYDEEDHPEREEWLAGSTWMRPVNSYIELPAFERDPWFIEREHNPKGQVVKHQFSSSILNNTRSVFTYTPPGYTIEDKPYGLLVLFDAWLYHRVIPTPIILDNLLAESRIPPVCAVIIDQPDLRDREEMVRNPPFLRFLTEELLPWVKDKYKVTIIPSEVMVGGSSMSGLAAGVAALQHPDIFGKVIMQSGAFTYHPDFGYDVPEGHAKEWLTRRYAESKMLPLEFYIDVGQFEDLLSCSRNMRDVLLGKGNVVHYQELYGGHNVLSWRNTLAEAILALVGK